MIQTKILKYWIVEETDNYIVMTQIIGKITGSRKNKLKRGESIKLPLNYSYIDTIKDIKTKGLTRVVYDELDNLLLWFSDPDSHDERIANAFSK